MEWLAQNGLSLILTVLFLLLVLRGPILGRIYAVEYLSVHALAARMKANSTAPILIDVRTPSEYGNGHIAGARNIPLSDLSDRIEALQQVAGQQDLVVICRSGARSLNGAVALKRAGFAKVYNLSGGMLQWSGQGYPVC